MSMLNTNRHDGLPAWQVYREHVGNEELAAAIAVLDAEPVGVVRRDASGWLSYSTSAGWADVSGVWHHEPVLDWAGWVADVDRRGRGWSGTQWRLFAVAAGLAADRPFALVGVLDQLAELKGPVLHTLVAWAAGGTSGQIRAASLRR